MCNSQFVFHHIHTYKFRRVLRGLNAALGNFVSPFEAIFLKLNIKICWNVINACNALFSSVVSDFWLQHKIQFFAIKIISCYLTIFKFIPRKFHGIWILNTTHTSSVSPWCPVYLLSCLLPCINIWMPILKLQCASFKSFLKIIYYSKFYNLNQQDLCKK